MKVCIALILSTVFGFYATSSHAQDADKFKGSSNGLNQLHYTVSPCPHPKDY